jgi:hypothetical protein
VQVEIRSVNVRAGVGHVELRVDLETAAALVPLVDSRVSIALGAVERASSAQVAGRARNAIKRSRKRDRDANAAVDAEQERRRARREKTGQERVAMMPNRGDSKVRVALRAQMPDGWLLVSDFAAMVCRAIPTIRNWISRGKLRARYVRDVPVSDYVRPSVKAISACQVERFKPKRAGRKHGKESAPVRMLVDHVGVPEAAKRCNMPEAAVRAGYEKPATLSEPDRITIRLALAAVLDDAARRDAGETVGMYDNDTAAADAVAWSESVGDRARR